ncbi:hypothetical protein MARINOS108_12149 [Marinoscillum sp. 108]|nr:hypothetical protein MARINOS108_12149 [Marinoscillum sp. 108]
MNGSFSQWQLYVPSENRLYSMLAVSNTPRWRTRVACALSSLEQYLFYSCDFLFFEYFSVVSRKYKFHNPEGLYFVSFATVYWLDPQWNWFLLETSIVRLCRAS